MGGGISSSQARVAVRPPPGGRQADHRNAAVLGSERSAEFARDAGDRGGDEGTAVATVSERVVEHVLEVEHLHEEQQDLK